jgi:hypothetical protein
VWKATKLARSYGESLIFDFNHELALQDDEALVALSVCVRRLAIAHPILVGGVIPNLQLLRLKANGITWRTT